MKRLPDDLALRGWADRAATADTDEDAAAMAGGSRLAKDLLEAEEDDDAQP